jgi:hypothetical protein
MHTVVNESYPIKKSTVDAPPKMLISQLSFARI